MGYLYAVLRLLPPFVSIADIIPRDEGEAFSGFHLQTLCLISTRCCEYTTREQFRCFCQLRYACARGILLDLSGQNMAWTEGRSHFLLATRSGYRVVQVFQ